MNYLALLNRDGGTLKTTNLDELENHLQATFKSAGHTLTIDVISGAQLTKKLGDFLDDDKYDALLIAGGDGTVSAGASALADTEKMLAVLPAGTMNLFARSLGISLDMEEAAKEIAQGTVSKVDVASINGRPFVHHVSIGLHPRAMRLRNKSNYSSRYGKILASARALVTVLSHLPAFNVRISADSGEAKLEKLSAISITNNAFNDAHLPYADSLSKGQLGIYLTQKLAFSSALKLMVDIFIGGWLSNESVSQDTAKTVEFEFPKIWRKAKASIDGEIVDLEESLTLKIHPDALNVIVPKTSPEQPGMHQV